MGIFDLESKMGKKKAFLLSMLPFLLCFCAYVAVAHYRHIENPKDKVVPTLYQIYDGFSTGAFQVDRSGHYVVVHDILASGKRFFIAMACLIPGIFLGLNMGIFPFFENLFTRFLIVFDSIPALSVLPILFIVFGLDEMAKVALIVIGVAPTIVRDVQSRVGSVPKELIVKALTLGASNLEVAYKVVMPQIMPHVLEGIRLSLKAMMLFLIAGESLSASEGLGFRIFVVRRYMSMDIIIPYVFIISLLLFSMDFMMKNFIGWKYPWVGKDQ